MSIAEPGTQTSNARSCREIFPLPLTTLESFMVADARAGYPMMCDIELEFDGLLRRDAFEVALGFALARNPLFSCRIERGANNGLVWVPADTTPLVQWIGMDTPLDDQYGATTDLFHACGLRIWVRTGEGRTKLLLHFHHACADAIGSFGFIGDLLSGYATASPGSQGQPTAREIDLARLLVRGDAGLSGRSRMQRLGDSVAGAREGAKFFIQRPQTLAPSTSRVDTTTPLRPTYITATLDESTTTELRGVAAEAGATANDVLLRDLYLTMRDWNTRHDDPPGRRRLRILMPQNLRSNADYAMPAANVMSFAFVTRSAPWCDRPAALLESIREETAAVRKGQLSRYFLGGLAALQANRLLDFVLNRRLCFATTILTNIGDPTRRFGTTFARSQNGLTIADVTLRGLAAVPPLRPQTRAAFAVSSTGPRLSINLKWDPQYLSPLDAEQLLGHYVAQLRATAQRAR
jgi:hypothetical protein